MLEDKIQQDYIQAMKAHDKVRSSTLSFLRAQLKNYRIDKRLPALEDKDVVSVIKKQVKQRQDSIEQYKLGNRQDLADKETAELKILQSYLPTEMSEADLQKIIDETIKESQAVSAKDMGKVMKALLPKVEGKADSKLVSELVKKSLS